MPSRFVPSSWLPTVCPVLGGVCGVYSESPWGVLTGTPGSLCCTDGMFEIFVLSGRCVCVLPAASFRHVFIQIHTTCCCFQEAPQKPLVHKRARSEGANWARVTRHPEKQAKEPRTAGLQQPACTNKEHQILSAAEATSFASQFWDRKMHPTKASQHEFLATCIDVDLEKKVKHAQWHKYTRKRGHQTTYFVPYRGAPRQISKPNFCTTSKYHAQLCSLWPRSKQVRPLPPL